MPSAAERAVWILSSSRPILPRHHSSSFVMVLRARSDCSLRCSSRAFEYARRACELEIWPQSGSWGFLPDLLYIVLHCVPHTTGHGRNCGLGCGEADGADLGGHARATVHVVPSVSCGVFGLDNRPGRPARSERRQPHVVVSRFACRKGP